MTIAGSHAEKAVTALRATQILRGARPEEYCGRGGRRHRQVSPRPQQDARKDTRSAGERNTQNPAELSHIWKHQWGGSGPGKKKQRQETLISTKALRREIEERQSLEEKRSSAGLSHYLEKWISSGFQAGYKVSRRCLHPSSGESQQDFRAI